MSIVNKTNFKVNPTRYLKINLFIIFLLMIGNILSNIYLALNLPFGIDKLFAFSREANIPTLFSSLNIFISSIFSYLLSKFKWVALKERKYWLLLSYIFIFLSIDETAGIHEKIGSLINFNFIDSFFMKNNWVLLYGLLVVFFLLYFSRFLKILDRQLRTQILLSGFIYLIGALGFEVLIELILSKPSDLLINNYITISILGTIEEASEMLGIAIFNFSLLKYIAKNQLNLLIIF